MSKQFQSNRECAGTTRRRNRYALLTAAAAAAVVGLGAPRSLSAATFTYTPNNGTTDLWSAGTDWDATPVSAAATTLTFVGTNTTVLADGLLNTSTDDIAGLFQLNVLNLQGT